MKRGDVVVQCLMLRATASNDATCGGSQRIEITRGTCGRRGGARINHVLDDRSAGSRRIRCHRRVFGINNAGVIRIDNGRLGVALGYLVDSLAIEEAQMRIVTRTVSIIALSLLIAVPSVAQSIGAFKPTGDPSYRHSSSRRESPDCWLHRHDERGTLGSCEPYVHTDWQHESSAMRAFGNATC